MRRPLALIVTPVALLLGGCLGGDGVEKVEAEGWVEDICAATARLDDAEFDAFEAYFETAPEGDGEKARGSFSQYVKDQEAALDRFARSAERAGQPDVAGGAEIAKAVQDWVSEERRNLERSQRKVKALKETGAELAGAVDDEFFAIELADLAEILEDTDARDADDIIELLDEDDACAAYLFPD